MEKNEFISYLKSASSKLSSVRYIKKSDSAYQELSEIERDLRHKCLIYFKLTWEEFRTNGFTRDLQLSTEILNKYTHKGSEKSKSDRIDEFKKEYLYDLGKLIFNLEYKPTEKAEPEG